jgi:hypothetical protein
MLPQTMRLVGIGAALAATLCVTFMAAPQARADEATPRVAVVVALTVNVPAERADELAAGVGEALRKRFVVDVLAGEDVERRLPAAGVPEDCVAQPACIADLSQRLAVDQLLMLVIVQVGDDLQIDTSAIVTKNGQVTSRPAIRLAAGDDPAEVFEEAAPRLMPSARARPVAVAGPFAPPPIPAVPRHMTAASWTTAAISGVAFTGAVVLGLSTRSTYNRCDADRDCSDSELDGIESRALAADLCWIAGAAAAGATLVLYLRSGEEERPGPVTGVSLGAAPLPGGAALSLGGSF